MGPVYNHKPVHHIQAVAKSSHFLLHNLISSYQQGPLVTLKINLALHNLLATASLPSSMSAPNTTLPFPVPASSTPLPLSITAVATGSQENLWKINYWRLQNSENLLRQNGWDAATVFTGSKLMNNFLCALITIIVGGGGGGGRIKIPFQPFSWLLLTLHGCLPQVQQAKNVHAWWYHVICWKVICKTVLHLTEILHL